MSKKTEIMGKLFDSQPLTNEEILFIGSCLPDTDSEPGKKGRKKKVGVMPYDHSVKESLSKACSLTNADFDHINSLIKSEVVGRKDELDTDSKMVEVYERIGLAKPQNFRLLMYQFVKMKSALQRGMGGISIKGGGGLDDFLKFLRGGM